MDNSINIIESTHSTAIINAFPHWHSLWHATTTVIDGVTRQHRRIYYSKSPLETLVLRQKHAIAAFETSGTNNISDAVSGSDSLVGIKRTLDQASTQLGMLLNKDALTMVAVCLPYKFC